MPIIPRNIPIFLKVPSIFENSVILRLIPVPKINAPFTIENNFWGEKLCKILINAAEQCSDNRKFVPSDKDQIPPYIAPKFVIKREALADESWEYDEYNWECFSLCLPIKGSMHSNLGVLAKKSSCFKYMEVLSLITNTLKNN